MRVCWRGRSSGGRSGDRGGSRGRGGLRLGRVHHVLHVDRDSRIPVLVDLALWIADYYGSTPGRALTLVAPVQRKARGEREAVQAGPNAEKAKPLARGGREVRDILDEGDRRG